MATHATPATPEQKIVTDAATAILGGTQLDDTTRMQAAGWATKLAADNGDNDMLDMIILLGASELKAALRKLIDMSIPDGQQNAAPANPLDSLINPTGAANGAASSTSTPPPAGGGQATPNPANTRRRNV